MFPGIEANRRTSPRMRAALVALAVAVWATWRAGWTDVVNTGGWSAFSRFWESIVRPDVSSSFLAQIWDATLQTLALAVLGSALAVAIGLGGAFLLTERLVSSAWLRRAASSGAALPRSVHEILVALLLVEVLGFDPLVAVLAIGLPFGAVTAKVYADAIDDADTAGFDTLRASGATRPMALLYGTGPLVRAEFVAYGFYRLECAIRSAAVLGIVGVGGLGFQLDLSFESLRYQEIWALIFALMLLSGCADAVSSTVRRAPGRVPVRWVGAAGLVLIIWSARYVELNVAALWSDRTLRRIPEFVADLVPPRLGPGGWRELWAATVDTVALSFIALVIAVVAGLIGAAMVRRPAVVAARRRFGVGWRPGAKVVLLLFRAVPAPIWAFLFVLILFPGLWPGAVALGVYNSGVLGRLFAEAIETRPADAEHAVALTGASGAMRWWYGVLPDAMPRLVSLSLYRGEVIVRETIVIGVVGAGGLGQLIRNHLAARDFAAVSAVVLVLIALAVIADSLGATLRRSIR